MPRSSPIPLLALLFTASLALGDQAQRRAAFDLRAHMNEETWRAAGLHRLDDGERQRLSAWVIGFARKVRGGEVALEPALPAEAVPYEKVRAFPQRYLGETLVFEGCSVKGKLDKDEGRFCLWVTTPAGSVAGPRVHEGNVAFVLPTDAMAERFLDLGLKVTGGYRARLTCTIGEHTGTAVAVLQRLELLDRAGEVYRVVVAD